MKLNFCDVIEIMRNVKMIDLIMTRLSSSIIFLNEMKIEQNCGRRITSSLQHVNG